MTGLLERDVDICGAKYRISRMSAFDQMHVATDYRDILMGIAMAKNMNDEMVKLRQKEIDEKGSSKIKVPSVAAQERSYEMMLVSRAGMSPETRGRAMNTCLRHVHRVEKTNVVPVLSSPDNMQFSDIDLKTMVPMLLDRKSVV